MEKVLYPDFNHTKPAIPLYIFDLDGTLSLADHRRHLVEAPKCAHCTGSGHIYRDVDDDAGGSIPVQGLCPYCDGKGKAKGFTPDWPAFYEACDKDQPNWPVISTLLQLYSVGCDVRIWSGRDDSVKPKTLMWLHLATRLSLTVLKELLVMRPNGDYTPDHQLKRKWLNLLQPQERRRLVGVFDDRQKVVDMWRAEGVACFQVAVGNF